MSFKSAPGRIWVVLGALCMLGMPILTQPAIAKKTSPSLVVRLNVLGAGFHYTGTLSADAHAVCQAVNDYLNKGSREYGVDYNVSGLINAAQAGDFTHDAFFLTVHRFRLGVTRYSNARQLDTTIIVQRHGYYGSGLFDRHFGMTVQLARNGLSGTFTATHVSAMKQFQGYPTLVDVRGSWTCSSLRRKIA